MSRTSSALLEALEAPEQRRYYTLTTVARALGLPESTVRGWADRDELITAQVRPGAQRFVPLTELQRLANQEHWIIDVDVLLDAD